MDFYIFKNYLIFDLFQQWFPLFEKTGELCKLLKLWRTLKSNHFVHWNQVLIFEHISITFNYSAKIT